MIQREMRSVYRMKIGYLVSVILCTLFFVPSDRAVLATAGDTSIDGGTIISVSASFCDADLLCDPEENYISCPVDCEAPPTPTTTPTSTPSSNTNGRSPSGYRTRVEAGGIVRLDEIEGDLSETTTPYNPLGPVVEFVEDFVSGGISSLPDPRITDPSIALFSNTIRVSIDPSAEKVSFDWLAGDRMIRVLRGITTFPKSTVEGGVVVYEGTAAGFTDTKIDPQTTYYYSLFIQGKDGGYSYRERVVVTTVEKTAYVLSTTTSGVEIVQYPQQIFSLLGILLVLIIVWKLFTRALTR